jgi:hypothetical protein
MLYPFFDLGARLGWSAPRSGRCTLGKETGYPTYSRLGGAKSRSERVRKISLPPRFDSGTGQLVAGRYAD